ncbi:MAG: RiPP maturation radical SAM C-methyltransferase [Spirochaetales bacterium]|nr:RiPP maturation radical SAM C-methyltransferase [Spirochaetales bacterium]
MLKPEIYDTGSPCQIDRWTGREKHVLVFNYTLTCPLACDFCCFHCHPGRQEKMPLDLAVSLVKQAVGVLYAGMLLAKEISVSIYNAISDSLNDHLFGERIFAAKAYGVPPLGRQAEKTLKSYCKKVESGDSKIIINYTLLEYLANYAGSWIDRLALSLMRVGFPVVGCTTIFQETAASVAILNAVKKLCPDVVTIIGGSNCTDSMAEGIVSLSAGIDYVFSGESESVFPEFLNNVLCGCPPLISIIPGEPCMDMDGIPTPDYQDYFQQREYCQKNGLSLPDLMKLPYETSRGCWWGQKFRCTFCGIRVTRFRKKSPDRVIEQLKSFLEKYPYQKIVNADEIMPYSYFKVLIPRLEKEIPSLHMFYEVKANLTLRQVRALCDAGIKVIQPGIEALSSPLLKQIRKGILSRQNIALLRYARSVYIQLDWNLLHGFPGDRPEDYEHYLTLIPRLRHLNPPNSFGKVYIVRFNSYFRFPDEYGIKYLKPKAVYSDILPEGSDLGKIAYYFDGEFSSIISKSPDLVKTIDDEVQAWRNAWLTASGELPMLFVSHVKSDIYLLLDTRGLPGMKNMQVIWHKQATAALVGRPITGNHTHSEEIEWAIENKLCIELDSWYVPLATADADLLEGLEAKSP